MSIQVIPYTHNFILSFPYFHSPILIHTGINTVLVPLYITEISPVKLRGAVGVLHQLATTISVLIAQILGIRTVSEEREGGREGRSQ